MLPVRHWCVALLVLAAAAVARTQPDRQLPAIHAQLDAYLHGDFDTVIEQVAARGNFGDLLDSLKRDGPAWIQAGGPAERARRALAAGTFALEATRAAEDEDWKWVQNITLGPEPVAQEGKFLPSTYRPERAVWWKTPPQLLEWGCATIRDIGAATPIERVWHLAAISVAQRRSDYEFLLGSPWELRENPKDEIEHLNHASFRFPDEPRIALAQSIAMEWRTWSLQARHARTATLNMPVAMEAFERQMNDPAIGAEATLRLGALRLRSRNTTGAIELFDRVERQTRDRYLIYLARYFSGQARERQNRPADAERAYRGALATVPKAISATMALASVLTRAGRTSEASALVESAMTALPRPVDPWRTYATADDRFWPMLISRLHEAIRAMGVGVVAAAAKPAAADDEGDNGDDDAAAKTAAAYTRPAAADEPPGAAHDTQQQPVFRTRTDAVTIDVTVRSQGQPLAGLTAKDFVLLDNGVPQTIEQIDMEAIPVDVSILVDLNEDLADDLKGMSNQIPRIVAMLRPTDRVRVTAINTHVTDLIRAQPAAEVPALGPLKPQGLSSAHDGIAAALLRNVDPNRRHLVIALTNGIDAVSALDAQAVRDIARYSNATLYIALADIVVLPGPPPEYQSGRQRQDGHRCMATGVCSPTKRFWQPFGDYEFETLAEAASLTGGKLYLPGIFTDRTAAAIFKKVFEDYRASYVLRYTPTGVTTAGWHEVKVTIPSRPSVELQARRGYFVETTSAPSERLNAATPGRTAVSDLSAAYSAGDFNRFVGGLQRIVNRGAFIRELRESGNPWPDNPNRESAFVLELVDFALQSPRREDREEGRRLLMAHRPLIRGPFGPDAYERYWLWAAILVLEGANQPDLAQKLIADGRALFPDEPRFRLASAFVTDQSRALHPLARNGVALPAEAAHVKAVAAAYDSAMDDPETAAEARIRKSWLLHRAARSEEALAVLDSIGTPPEALLDYLRHLIRGRVLDGLNRLDDAAAAFRAAALLFPDGQSARVGLMTVLQKQGNSPAALEQAELIQRMSPDAVDPWWRYWQGDYRLVATAFTRLREQGR